MIDVSIVIFGNNESNWFKFYNSCFWACKKYNWELIIVSPIEPTHLELQASTKVQWLAEDNEVIKQYAIIKAMARSDMLIMCKDTVILSENFIDKILDDPDSYEPINHIFLMRKGEQGEN